MGDRQSRWQRGRWSVTQTRQTKKPPEVIGSLIGAVGGVGIPLAFNETGYWLILWAGVGALLGYLSPPIWAFVYTASTYRIWVLENRVEQLALQGGLVPAKAEKPVAPAVQKLITHVEEAELLRKRFLQTAKGAAPFDLLQDVVAWE